jgi:nicotinate-nucleotide pyrophosphorylase (carboxylating)
VTHSPAAQANDLDALFAEMVPPEVLERLARTAWAEDLGPRGLDLTSAALARATGGAEASARVAHARLVAREACIVAGLPAISTLARVFAPGVKIMTHARDAQDADRGDVLAELTGPETQLLALERTMLNLLSRLSGVATRTRAFADAIPPDARARVYDTRKTTPGLRELEKYAVRCGGGGSHRMGLFDAVLVKDNHLAGVPDDALPAIIERIAREARALAAPDRVLFVEVEVDRAEQFERLVGLPEGVIDIVLLDNMSLADMRRCAETRDRYAPRLQLEASGGVTLETIADIARTGVDRISVGSLTHGARSVDLALDFDAPEPHGASTQGARS